MPITTRKRSVTDTAIHFFRLGVFNLILMLATLGSALVNADTPPSSPEQVSRPAQLTIQLTDQPSKRGTYSSKQQTIRTVRVISGQTATLARSSGVAYELNSSDSFLWAPMREVAANQETMQLAPLVLDDGSVQIHVTVSGKDGYQQNYFNSTLIVAPGEWSQIMGNVPDTRSGGTTYSTASKDQETLFIKVMVD